MPHRLSGVYNNGDLRDLARRRLPRAIFEYVDRGSEDDIAVRATGQRSTRSRSVRARGRRLAARPVDHAVRQAAQNAGHHRADRRRRADAGLMPNSCLARAAAKAGIPITIATAATVPMEQVAAEATSGYWQQLYLWNDRALSHQIVERANAAGAEALMLTVDTAVGSNREHNARNGFSNPFKLTPRIALDIARHPRWLINDDGPLHDERRHAAVRELSGRRAPEDHRRADLAVTVAVGELERREGIAGHVAAHFHAQGRDVAGRCAPRRGSRRRCASSCRTMADASSMPSEATIDALPDIVVAVGDRMTVLFDSGLRRGADVVKALALGAKAVLVGRATLFGCSCRRRTRRCAGAGDAARRDRPDAGALRLPEFFGGGPVTSATEIALSNGIGGRSQRDANSTSRSDQLAVCRSDRRSWRCLWSRRGWFHAASEHRRASCVRIYNGTVAEAVTQAQALRRFLVVVSAAHVRRRCMVGPAKLRAEIPSVAVTRRAESMPPG